MLVEQRNINWRYHERAPKSGRRLLLLDITEIETCIPLLTRVLESKSLTRRVGWFTPDLLNNKEYYQTTYIALCNILQRLSEQVQYEQHDINYLNSLLNMTFSDLGWRNMRKEISQLKKRQKKSHIELSNDLIVTLKNYMQQHSFDSFDQAIDNLLSESKTFEEDFDNK